VARKRVVISGRVQGVSFRAYAADEARRLGLAGWVRNRKDRTVEALVAGDDAAIDAFVRWCHEGSPAAQVTGVEVEDDRGTDRLEGFRIAATS
jgi:acylphosphatase